MLVEEYPKTREGQFDHAFDVILMTVVSIVPTPVNGRVSLAPQRREERHPDKAGYNLVTMFWWEDVTIRFDVLAKTNFDANRLAGWFHRFLLRYAGVLKFFEARGMKNFKFVERGPDARNRDDYSQELLIRPLSYAFRIEIHETGEVKIIDNVRIQLDQAAA